MVILNEGMSQHRLTADIRCAASQIGFWRIRLSRTSPISGVLYVIVLKGGYKK